MSNTFEVKVAFIEEDATFIATGETEFGFVNTVGSSIEEIAANVQECVSLLTDGVISEEFAPVATLVECSLEDFDA